MSIRIKEKKTKEQSTVVSKYFPTEMDESLSEFKTPRKKKSASSTDKAENSKKPAAKATKKKSVKPKGQKDIRAALKSQVNELENHSVDFQNVCTENGVDVDPEHLQLAIALSISLHENHSSSSQQNPGNSGESSAGTSQNFNDLSQTSRVRKALEKYGFIFPNSHTNKIVNQEVSKIKPASRRRKSSILFKETLQKREEKVADKVTKILLTTLNNLLKVTSDEHNVTIRYENHLQHPKSITARNNLSYIDVLQNDGEFYVENIFEQSKIKVGSLLRDWSTIPGREKSPDREFKVVNRSFQEYITNQADLDTLLSGISEKCIFNINDCVDTKHGFVSQHDSAFVENSLDSPERPDNVKQNLLLNKDFHRPENFACGFIITEKQNELLEGPKPGNFRSYSPDIFDDDDNDSSRNGMSLPESHEGASPAVAFRKMSDHGRFTPITYKTSEVTQRRSNDYMDLTECIPAFAKDKSLVSNKIIFTDKILVDLTPVEDRMIIINDSIRTENIDLTQSSSENSNPSENLGRASLETMQDKKKYPDEIESNGTNLFVCENLDLSQSSDDLNLSIENDISKKNKIDLKSKNNDNDTLFDSTKVVKNLDLTQSSSDSLNLSTEHNVNYNLGTSEIELESKKKYSEELKSDNLFVQKNVDPTQVSGGTTTAHDPNDITDATQSYNNEIELIQKNEESYFETNFDSHNLEIINGTMITQSSNRKRDDNLQECWDAKKPSFNFRNGGLLKHCEDFLADNPSRSIEKNSSFRNNPEKPNQSFNFSSGDANISDRTNESPQNSNNNSDGSTGKHSQESTFSSQNSNCDVFDISDEELDYSMQHYKDFKNISESIDKVDDDLNVLQDERCSELIQSAQKSKICNFDIGGSSIFDGISIDSESGISNGNNNYSRVLNSKDMSIDCHEVTESSLFLPDVKLGGIECVKSIERKQEQTGGSDIKKSEITENGIFSDFVTKNNFSTPKSNKMNVVSNVTPCNNQYMVRMAQITPMMDYRNMSSPDRNCELDKFGIKPFKRKRAIQLLEHIYYQTHPTIDGNEELADNVCQSLKRRRLSESAVNNSRIEVIDTSPVSSQKCPQNEDLTNMNFHSEKPSSSELLTNEKTARRSLKKIISENNFGNKPRTSEYFNAHSKVQNDISHGDFLADDSKKHWNEEIKNCNGFGQRSQQKFSPKKSKKQSDVIPISIKNKPKTEKLCYTNLESENDNLFDELISGNIKKNSNGKLNFSPRKPEADNTLKKVTENVNDLCEDSTSRKEITKNTENEDIMYPVKNWKPDLKEINCESCDWFFQKREKAKVLGCRVPLHIAFYNYVNARPKLWSAILRYEPINIDAVHKGLLEDGYRYDSKDILRFMDKKCITVKTSDNDARNANQQKKPKPTLSQKSKR